MKSRKRTIFGLIFLLPILAACTPAQKYSQDKSLGVYFAVPHSWNQIPSASVNNALLDYAGSGGANVVSESRFFAAYSPSKNLSAKELISALPPSAPIVEVRVLQLSFAESDSLSMNSLRNHIFPVLTSLGVDANIANNVNLIDDHYISSTQGTGVSTTFTFENTPTLSQEVTQEFLISNDRQFLYEFLIRANTKDQVKFNKEIKSIIDSFRIVKH